MEAVRHFQHPHTEADEWPKSHRPDVIDQVERVTDLDAITALHRLAREEGLLMGGSSGIAVAAALRTARTLGSDEVVVVIAPDSGRSYLSKYYNDDRLGQLGFPLYGKASDDRVSETLHGRYGPFHYVPSSASVATALEWIGSRDSLPVVLERPGRGPIPVGEILGTATASRMRAAPGRDLVTALLDPPLYRRIDRTDIDSRTAPCNAHSGGRDHGRGHSNRTCERRRYSVNFIPREYDPICPAPNEPTIR
ncbi:pyridoxal-phosphate dependent enzyme [Rhodococcus globerulus]|uniref:pyridoxal-phosphate dependent enzyme n=1 Tax=Rhodococcus globerulus TaxID=33008 RepID=UPI00374E8576